MYVRVVANDDPDVRKRFHSRMLRIYADAKREVGYNATYILRMLSERGGRYRTQVRCLEPTFGWLHSSISRGIWI